MKKSYNEIFDEISNWLDNLEINITEEQILNFLKINKRWPNKYSHTDDYSSVEIINFFSQRNHEVYRNQLFDLSGYLNFTKLKRYYDNGTTILLCDILDLTPELRKVCDYFEDNFGTPVQGNFYLSGASTEGFPSFGPHEHHYDVFVKQIYGWSKWITDGNEVVLNPGDVIVVPAGTTHQVTEQSDKRLSLTINRQ